MAGDQEVQVDVRSRTMTVEAEGALARVVVEEAVLGSCNLLMML